MDNRMMLITVSMVTLVTWGITSLTILWAPNAEIVHILVWETKITIWNMDIWTLVSELWPQTKMVVKYSLLIVLISLTIVAISKFFKRNGEDFISDWFHTISTV